MGVSSSEETMATRPGYPCCVFRGGDQMYALDPASGKILWHCAACGSVGSHPAVADGIVFWSSGFSPVFGNIQGVRQNNKFFAFSVDGK
jgi:outer membrane protein assembly factor BamB